MIMTTDQGADLKTTASAFGFVAKAAGIPMSDLGDAPEAAFVGGSSLAARLVVRQLQDSVTDDQNQTKIMSASSFEELLDRLYQARR